MTVKEQITSDSADMLVRLAIEGVGIIRLGELAVVSAIRKGLLEPLLQDSHKPSSYPLWAVMPPGRPRALKVKVFLDFLTEHFGSAPWRINSIGASIPRSPA